MHFFKIHHGFCNNPKFNLISHNTKQPKAIVLAVITSLLEYASMQKPRGSIDGFNAEAYAYDLGINEDSVVTICNALRNIEFISDSSIRNWEEYQTYDRTGAERQRKFRQNKKLVSSAVTDVTERNALRNTEEKRRDKKRKEEKDNIGDFYAIPDWIPSSAWNEFKEMRVKIKKPMTLRAAHLILDKLDRFRTLGHDPTTVLNQSIINNWQDIYEPKGQSNAAHKKLNSEYNQPSKTERLYAAARRAAEAGGFASGFNSESQTNGDVGSMLPIIEDVR